MNDLFETIGKALPFIARCCSGTTTLLDRATARVMTVDAQGNGLKDYPLENYSALEQVIQNGQPLLVPSKTQKGMVNLFVPLGECLLMVNKSGSMEIDERLKTIFVEAIPLIARVAGGEAVLFDQDGIRFFGVDPDGRESDKGIGQLSLLGKNAMEFRRPVIGPSMVEEGALAVRIPITGYFGIGFNNAVSVRQKKSLAASIHYRRAQYTFASIVGNSERIRSCVEQARKVAETSSTVLVTGETGTGKELFVQSIHSASQRSSGPFVAINCGAMPASLVESQLFGYATGSFTGARKEGQQGLFEQANGGTLFLDEISEMELELQSRLLRVLQEREVVRIGGKRVIPVDVRVIATTNRDLHQMVARGRFRQDLFYRLNVVELHTPPLREMVEDIPLLVRFFIKRFRCLFGSFIQEISDKALECLMGYPWPGNVRELQNCIERIMNLATHQVIQLEDIPVIIRDGRRPDWCLPTESRGARSDSVDPLSVIDRDLRADPLATPVNSEHDSPSEDGGSLKQPTQAIQRALILQALEKAGYRRSLAASRLGISTTTLWRKMKRLGIPPQP